MPPEWWQPFLGGVQATSVRELFVRLLTALVLGVGVAKIYRHTRSAANLTPTFSGTLVLLCVLIGMVSQVIGDNVALAFSLVGALSIVRFRTSVRDTKDTTFVIFAVGVGMAVGVGDTLVALGGMLVVGFAAWLYRDRVNGGDWSGVTLELSVKMGWSAGQEERVLAVIQRASVDVQRLAVGTARQGAALEGVYRVRLLPNVSPIPLLAELNQLEGVQGAGLKREGEPKD